MVLAARKACHRILFSDQLTGRHHHRRSFRHLVTEYSRAAGGCAQFVKAHPDCPLARKRRQQATLLPITGLAGLASLAAAAATGHALAALTVVAAGIGVLMAREFAHSRTAESLAYPLAGGTLGLVFTTSLARGLVLSRTPGKSDAPSWGASSEPNSSPHLLAARGHPRLAGRAITHSRLEQYGIRG